VSYLDQIYVRNLHKAGEILIIWFTVAHQGFCFHIQNWTLLM